MGKILMGISPTREVIVVKSIEELAQVQGIVLACEFSPDGTLLKYEAHMEAPRELAEKAAQYIATVSMMFKTLSYAFSKESEMKWTPQRFWTYQGGHYTVICSGNKAVFAE